MYGSAIIEIMRPIKTSINVSRVFAFPTEEFLLKRSRQYECILGVIKVMSLAAEQWCISVNLITVCTFSFETAVRNYRGLCRVILIISDLLTSLIKIYNYIQCKIQKLQLHALNKFNNNINCKR